MARRRLEGLAALRQALVIVAALIAGLCPAHAEPACCSGPDCATTFAGDRVALIVGVDDYAFARTNVKPLKNAVADARTIATILRDQNFSVVCLENATSQQLVEALRALGAHMRQRQTDVGPVDGQVSIVFFAGHGFATRASDIVLLAPEPCKEGQDCPKPLREDLALGVFEMDGIVGLEGSTSFDRIVIIDACRTPLEGGIRTLAGDDAAHFGRYRQPPESSSTVFIVSTSAGEPAIDRHEELGADTNGLFISRLRHILSFRSIGMDDVFGTTKSAFAVLDDPAVKQRPVLHNYQTFLQDKDLRGRQTKADQCSAAFDRNIWRLNKCREGDGNCPLAYCNFARTFCDGSNCLTEQEKACLRPLLTSIKPDPEAFCVDHPPGPQQTARVRTQPLFNELTTAQLESFSRASRQTMAQAQRLETIARADIPDRTSSGQQRWEVEVRKELLRPIDARPETRAPMNLTIGPGRTVNVREVPNAASATMRIASAGDRLVADCFSQPCPEGWMGVRLHADGDIFRGWISLPEAVALATIDAADEVFPLSFIGDTTRPSAVELERLIARLRVLSQGREPGQARRLAAGIVVTQPGETFTDASLADARVARIRAALDRSGVPIQNIAPAIQVVPASAQATGTVRLSVR